MKKRALLIAEKPDLMRAVQAVYNKHGHADTIEFETFVGHTMRLKNPAEYDPKWAKWTKEGLPIIPDEFTYAPSVDKIDIYQKIKQRISNGNYDYLINCCDPDREGEAIFATFYKSIGCKLPVKRMWHLDLTDKELKKNLDNPRDSQKESALVNLKEASLLRMNFDWLVGMNYSRAVTLMSNKTIPLGRVMTPTLKIVVDRELEINNFKPTNFWEIESEFTGYKGIYFDHKNENETKLSDKSEAEKIIAKLGKDGVIETINTNKVVSHAPRLHSLADIQNEANKVYGFTLDVTLGLIQALYEKKILSYPRTDCSYISAEVAKGLRSNINAILNVPDVKAFASTITDSDISAMTKNKRYVDDKKVTAHYAIIPTGTPFIFDTLPKKEQNILSLVAKRLVAIFMDPIVSNKTNVVTNSNGYKFRTSGSILLDKGYSVLYKRTFTDNELPNLKKGDIYPLTDTILLEKITSPPKRYTDGTLNSAMENAGRFVEEDDTEIKEILKDVEGIGTPATRAGIITKLINLKLIERQGRGKAKVFAATPNAIIIIKALNKFQIVSPELTGIWEGKLKEVESGKLKPEQFEKEMIDYIKEQTSEILSNVSIVFSSLAGKEELGNCPLCENKIVAGKNYYLCSNYGKDDDNCSFVMGKTILGANISKNDVSNLLSFKQTRKLKFVNNKGKKFEGSLVYDKKDKKIVFVFEDNNKGDSKVLGTCPTCGQDVLDRGTFCSCRDYKNCKFSLSYTIKSAKLTQTDIQLLLAGKETGIKTFTWNKTSKGEAKMAYNKKNQKIEFIFINKNS